MEVGLFRIEACLAQSRELRAQTEQMGRSLVEWMRNRPEGLVADDRRSARQQQCIAVARRTRKARAARTVLARIAERAGLARVFDLNTRVARCHAI